MRKVIIAGLSGATLLVGAGTALAGAAGSAAAAPQPNTSLQVQLGGQVSAGSDGVQACATASATVNGQSTEVSQCTP